MHDAMRAAWPLCVCALCIARPPLRESRSRQHLGGCLYARALCRNRGCQEFFETGATLVLCRMNGGDDSGSACQSDESDPVRSAEMVRRHSDASSSAPSRKRPREVTSSSSGDRDSRVALFDQPMEFEGMLAAIRGSINQLETSSNNEPEKIRHLTLAYHVIEKVRDMHERPNGRICMEVDTASDASTAGEGEAEAEAVEAEGEAEAVPVEAEGEELGERGGGVETEAVEGGGEAVEGREAVVQAMAVEAEAEAVEAEAEAEAVHVEAEGEELGERGGAVGEDSDSECCICLHPMTRQEMIVGFPCPGITRAGQFHRFHLGCVAGWFDPEHRQLASRPHADPNISESAIVNAEPGKGCPTCKGQVTRFVNLGGPPDFAPLGDPVLVNAPATNRTSTRIAGRQSDEATLGALRLQSVHRQLQSRGVWLATTGIHAPPLGERRSGGGTSAASRDPSSRANAVLAPLPPAQGEAGGEGGEDREGEELGERGRGVEAEAVEGEGEAVEGGEAMAVEGEGGEAAAEAMALEASSSGGGPRFMLLCGHDAEQPERTRALAQAMEQGFKVPVSKKSPLRPGWAIGKTASGIGADGRDFALVCVLTRARRLSEGGKPCDVITYIKDKNARVLLSPAGALAFQVVDQEMTAKKLKPLRCKPKIDEPPSQLVNDLISAGLSRSLDSGMALPPRVSEAIFKAWWRHHCLSIEAMKRDATGDAIKRAREATDHLYGMLGADS